MPLDFIPALNFQNYISADNIIASNFAKQFVAFITALNFQQQKKMCFNFIVALVF
jgi:hypothetical protein